MSQTGPRCLGHFVRIPCFKQRAGGSGQALAICVGGVEQGHVLSLPTKQCHELMNGRTVVGTACRRGLAQTVGAARATSGTTDVAEPVAKGLFGEWRTRPEAGLLVGRDCTWWPSQAVKLSPPISQRVQSARSPQQKRAASNQRRRTTRWKRFWQHL